MYLTVCSVLSNYIGGCHHLCSSNVTMVALLPTHRSALGDHLFPVIIILMIIAVVMLHLISAVPSTVGLPCQNVVDAQANPSDADQIYSAIYSRAQKLKSSAAAAAVTKQTSPIVGKDLSSTPTSSVSLTAKRPPCDSVTESDTSIAEKRRRSLFVYLFLNYLTQSYTVI